MYTATEIWHTSRIKILWYSANPHAFEVPKLSQYIQDRAIVTAEGKRISEWDVAIRDIELFLGGRVAAP
jgi:hypothetical protein